MLGHVGSVPIDFDGARSFATIEFMQRNPLTGEYEFALLKVDHAVVAHLLREEEIRGTAPF